MTLSLRALAPLHNVKFWADLKGGRQQTLPQAVLHNVLE